MYKILNIAAHYGGGVGTVTKAIRDNDKENIHTFSYLNNVPENKKDGHVLFGVNMIKDHDIVLVHVWNHPALFDFILNTKLPECRMIGWSHMSGKFPPYILFDKLKNYFDEFYYTSPISGNDRDFIWSSCDIDKYLNVEKKEHDGFNIGYIGTVDYCKLHPKFIEICKSINIPDVTFTIVGGGCDFDKMKEEIGNDNRFVLTGKVKDVIPCIEKFDLFLYPLHQRHFGTCEQVLGETMAAGIPIVAFDNPAENYIITNGVSGHICKNTEELIGNIYGFFFKVKQYNKIASKNIAKKMYSVATTMHHLNNAFDNIMNKEPRERSWKQGNHIFIESLGPYGDLFEKFPMQLVVENPHHWTSENKGSIKQYANYFPDDKYLQELRRIIDEKLPNM